VQQNKNQKDKENKEKKRKNAMFESMIIVGTCIM
jgi:hypothetical protein